MSKTLSAIAATAALVVAVASGCGGGGGTSPEAAAVACLKANGAEVMRERDEVSAGFYEIAAVAKKDRGPLRILLVNHPSEATDIARQLQFEMDHIRGFGLGIVKPVRAGHVVTAVYAVNPESILHPKTALATFPSEADEAIVRKCAVVP